MAMDYAKRHASVPGRRTCMSCQKPFLSKDVERIRRCNKCKERDDDFHPHAGKMSEIGGAIRSHFREHP